MKAPPPPQTSAKQPQPPQASAKQPPQPQTSAKQPPQPQTSAKQPPQPQTSAPPSTSSSKGIRAGARTLLMVSLTRFYGVSSNVAKALPYLTGSSPMSLRLIDWFVTNYAKTHNVVLMTSTGNSQIGTRRDPGSGSGGNSHLNVYLSYRSQLKAYSKLQFDPFRRRERMHFFYQPDKSFETTIGQLNFFRWMIQNNILDYITEHAPDIERDMLQTLQAAATPSPLLKKAHPPQPRHAAEDPVEAQAAEGSRKRAPSALCRVARNMTRVSGNHTVVFE